MRLLLTTISIVTVHALPLAKRDSATGPTATIQNGTIAGLYNSNWNEDEFLGIPYAQPPVGDLRLKGPLPLNTSFGTLQATSYGPHCWDAKPTSGYDDNTGFNSSEDCLTLNVIRPAGVSKGDKLPVLFWVHGGGLTTGGSGNYRYNASALVGASVDNGHPLIFVGINYRLGPFGFLASKALADEGDLNVGFRDQRLALSWVQANIQSFGGDPSQVTIQGESAGGLSINAHIVAFSGQNNNLFHQAISESGGYFGQYINPYASDINIAFSSLLGNTSCASTIGASSQAQLACVRSLTAEEFRNNTASALFDFDFAKDGTIFTQDSTPAAYAAGQYVKLPLLIGDNTDEGVSFGPQGANTTSQASDLLAFLTPAAIPENDRSALLALYPNVPALGAPFNTGDFQLPVGYEGVSTPGLQNKRLAAIAGDRFTVAGDRFVARTMSQSADVYKYRFNHIPWNTSYEKLDYIGHFTEVSYVFNLQNDNIAFWEQNHFTATYLGDGAPIPDRFLGDYMSRSWAAFAATGDPNNANVTTKVSWPKYSDGHQNLVFQTEGSVVENDDFRKDGIDYLIQNVLL